MNEFLTILGNLLGGFATAAQPFNLLMLLIGVLLGLIIGVLPGLGGTSGVAILLPVTVYIASSGPGGATSAVILLAGIYWGALFGGVITSILFNIPGEPWSVVLLFDGFPLAKRKGKPGLALTSSFLSSFVGAFIATLLFTFFAQWIADKALSFGPPELFAVFVLSFATLVALGAESPFKAVAMLALGLLLAAVGFDTITGSQGLIASIYLGHFLTFAICLLAVPLLAMIMRVPYAINTPFIVVISIIGSYSLNNSMLDVSWTILFGLVGYWLRKMKYPLAPLVVALVLGDSAERELRKSLIAGAGNPGIFFSSPLASLIMILAVIV